MPKNFKSFLLEQTDTFETKEAFIKKLKLSYPNGLSLTNFPKNVLIGTFEFELDGFTIPTLRSKLELRETDAGKAHYVVMAPDKKPVMDSLGMWDFSIDFNILAKI